MSPGTGGRTAKCGERRVYESVLVRRRLPGRRQGPARDAGEPVRAPGRGGIRDRGHLEGRAAGPAGQAVAVAGSLPHGHVAAVHAAGAAACHAAGPGRPPRDLALALIISRVVRRPVSTLTWWNNATLAATSASPMPTPIDIYARDGLGGTATRSRRSWPTAAWPRATVEDGAAGPVVLVAGTQCPLAAAATVPGHRRRETAVVRLLATEGRRVASGLPRRRPVTRPRSPPSRTSSTSSAGRDGHGRRPAG